MDRKTERYTCTSNRNTLKTWDKLITHILSMYII